MCRCSASGRSGFLSSWACGPSRTRLDVACGVDARVGDSGVLRVLFDPAERAFFEQASYACAAGACERVEDDPVGRCREPDEPAHQLDGLDGFVVVDWLAGLAPCRLAVGLQAAVAFGAAGLRAVEEAAGAAGGASSSRRDAALSVEPAVDDVEFRRVPPCREAAAAAVSGLFVECAGGLGVDGYVGRPAAVAAGPAGGEPAFVARAGRPVGPVVCAPVSVAGRRVEEAGVDVESSGTVPGVGGRCRVGRGGAREDDRFPGGFEFRVDAGRQAASLREALAVGAR